MDDVSPEPQPRPTARAPKRVAPANSIIDDRPRRRTPARTTSSSATVSGMGDAPVLATSSIIADPLLLQPVRDGTPVEIPIIVPAQFDDDEPTVAVPRTAIAATERFADEFVPEPIPEPQVAQSHGPRQITMGKARRPRVRRVTRVIRQVDTWSVFKVALVFSLFLYLVCLTAGVLLWQVAQNTGTVDNVERFFESFGWQSFQLNGGAIFHNAWVGGLFVVVGMTGLGVLVATMFNLIAELVGGIRVTVLEEEVIAREERGLGWRSGLRRGGSHPADLGSHAAD